MNGARAPKRDRSSLELMALKTEPIREVILSITPKWMPKFLHLYYIYKYASVFPPNLAIKAEWFVSPLPSPENIILLMRRSNLRSESEMRCWERYVRGPVAWRRIAGEYRPTVNYVKWGEVTLRFFKSCQAVEMCFSGNTLLKTAAVNTESSTLLNQQGRLQSLVDCCAQIILLAIWKHIFWQLAKWILRKNHKNRGAINGCSYQQNCKWQAVVIKHQVSVQMSWTPPQLDVLYNIQTASREVLGGNTPAIWSCL